MQSPLEIFDRWQPYRNKTIAYHYFLKDQTDLNTFFWSFHGVSDHIHREKVINKWPDESQISLHINFGRDKGRRGTLSVSRFIKEGINMKKWINLVTLTSIASYFELYLNRSVAFSIRSNPGLIIKKSKAVDGINLLKNCQMIDVDGYVRNCVEGDWSKRYNAIRNLFDKEFPIMNGNISALQSSQSIRNKVAHEFGRDTGETYYPNYIMPNDRATISHTSVSLDRIVNYLKTIGETASEFHNLTSEHIGSFEFIEFYHRYNRAFFEDRKNIPQMYKQKDHEKVLSKRSQEIFNFGMHRAYANDLINYYKSM
jgi:hypothetical protein